MDEHLSPRIPEIVPPGLRKRWEEFGEASRSCWAEIKPLKLPTMTAFERYWLCMKKRAAHLLTVEEAIKYGVKPHPICVLAKRADGISEAEARRQCIEEGKFHGVSLIAGELRKEGLL